MGLFDRVFEKKYCAICGKELGLLGKTKIADGHICKDCDAKLSPYFRGYSSATTADIQGQIEAREQNKQAVAAFHIGRTLGQGDTKVYVDEEAGKVIFSRVSPSNWSSSNPDVLDFSQITGCEYRVEESKTEIKRKDAEGKEVSYEPKRYDIDFDFYVTVYTSHPYVGQIDFKVNKKHIDRKVSAEYREAEAAAADIKAALTQVRDERRAAAAPKAAVTCPHCGATTIPDASGCCEYCGGAVA